MELGREEVNCDAGLRKCRSTRQKALAHQSFLCWAGAFLSLPASVTSVGKGLSVQGLWQSSSLQLRQTIRELTGGDCPLTSPLAAGQQSLHEGGLSGGSLCSPHR